jgi:hypothetical protein
VEDTVGCEPLGDVIAPGGSGVDSRQPRSDFLRDAAFRMSVAKLVLPQAMARRIEEFHREQACLGIVAEHRRRRTGNDRGRFHHPSDFVSVTLDRRPPIVANLEPGQRPLDAKCAARGFDPPDIRRYAAAHRGGMHRIARSQEAHTLERRAKLRLDIAEVTTRRNFGGPGLHLGSGKAASRRADLASDKCRTPGIVSRSAFIRPRRSPSPSPPARRRT